MNRIIEYDKEMYLAVSWDNNKYIFINNRQENITNILNHPVVDKTDIRCWGLCKVGNFDLDTCPFVMARDNLGYVLINVKTIRTYMLYNSPVSANLFGHGDILRIVKQDNDRQRIMTVIQEQGGSEKCQLLSFQMSPAFNEALVLLAKSEH